MHTLIYWKKINHPNSKLVLCILCKQSYFPHMNAYCSPSLFWCTKDVPHHILRSVRRIQNQHFEDEVDLTGVMCYVTRFEAWVAEVQHTGIWKINRHRGSMHACVGVGINPILLESFWHCHICKPWLCYQPYCDHCHGSMKVQSNSKQKGCTTPEMYNTALETAATH